jgi:molybdopterin-binding protein
MAPAAADAGRRRDRSPRISRDPGFAEHVCLALIAEGVSHGWALGSLLGPSGELGRIWSLSRPLTYRAVDLLATRGLIDREGRRSGPGRDRIVLEVTAAGGAVARHWLDTPVAHLRDVRTELLVKLTLRVRAGLDNETFLAAQEARFEPAIRALTGEGPSLVPVPAAVGPADDLVGLWRRESARAVRRFLREARGEATGSGPVSADARAATESRTGPDLRLSARNQVRARIVGVQQGEVLSSVRAAVDDNQVLTSIITRDAVDELDLTRGDAVVMIVKSTEVMVAKAP